MSEDIDALHTLFAEVSLGAPENAVGFVLWRVMHRYKRAIDRALKSTGLTHLQFTALAMAAWLAKSDEPVTQAALAKAGEIHPMQVSQILKALETKGLVDRARDPRDVRAKRVEITAEGVGLLRQAMPLVVCVQQRMFGGAEAETGNLLSMLRQIEADDRDMD